MRPVLGNRSGLWCVTLCLGALFSLRAGAEDAALRVVLKDGLIYQERGGKAKTLARDVQVDVARRAEKWGPVAWGFTDFTPGIEHLGKVLEATENGDALTLRIELQIGHSRNQPMVVGGQAVYTIELKRAGSAYTGAFTGECRDSNRPDLIEALEKSWGFGHTIGGADWSQPLIRNRATALLASGAVKGEATARMTSDPVLLADWSRIKPEEHPRLLFRKADLPRLRERAATPQGQKIIADLKAMLDRADQYGFAFFPPAAEAGMGNVWATGHGLLYQLTGEEKYARRAAQLCYANLYGNYWYGGGGVHPYTLMGIAFAYDLCADAWDEPTRQLFYSYLEQNIRQLAMRFDAPDYLGTSDRFTFANDQSGFALSGVRDSYHNKFRAAAAIAALALLNDPPPAYRPQPLAEVPVIEPAAGYEPWIGVPVEPFESDIMPRHWLINGPFRRGTSDEALAAIGGLGGARPEPGTAVKSDGVDVDFRTYRPSGWQATHGGTIYARNCSRYWASATGGGYNPGIGLMRKWRDEAGKNLAVNVCLYTVIDNDRERVVQALPNWRSRSSGNRMWINGRAVRDGDLVQLKKGLYPLMVDVAVVGGYSAQAPKLREYTPQIHAKESAAEKRAIQAMSGETPADNQMLRNLLTLLRSVQRYIPADIGPEGWEAWDAQESLLPLMLALRQSAGVDMAKSTGLANMLPMAVRMRGHSSDRGFDYAVSQSIALMPPEHLPVARWYLDRYGLGIARPLDALIALVTHPLDTKPQPPEKIFQRSGIFGGYNVHAFRSGWEGSKDFLTLIEAGSPSFTPAYNAGAVTLHGLGRPWIHARRGEDYLWSNSLSIRGYAPTQQAKVLHSEYRPDGSGSLTLALAGFRAMEVQEEKKSAFKFSGPDAGMSIQRAFAVDYSGASGAPVMLVMVDRIAGAAFREKTWRFDLGDVGAFDRSSAECVHLGTNQFLVRPHASKRLPETPAGASMKVTFVSPGKIDFVERRYGEGRRTVLEAKLEKFVSRDARAVKVGPEIGPLPPDLDEFADELNNRDQAAERKRLPPIVVFTIITVQEGEPPKVSVEGQGAAAVLTVGRRAARFDGNKVVLGN